MLKRSRYFYEKLNMSLQSGPDKRHKVNGAIILQQYVTESGGFQQRLKKTLLTFKSKCLNTAV